MPVDSYAHVCYINVNDYLGGVFMASRVQSVQANLSKKKLNATVISDILSIEYLIGRSASHIGERLFALVVPTQGKCTLFVNELFPIMGDELFDVIYHNDNDIATQGLAKALPTGPVGIDRFLPSQFLIEIMQQRADITPVLGSFAVDDARMLKDEEEKQALRAASKINDAVFAQIPHMLYEGITEIELAKQISEVYAQLGDPAAPTAIPLVCFGPGSAEPHHTNSDAKLKPADVVLIDGGQCSYKYNSDTTRTFFFKTVTPEQEKVYNIVLQANHLALEAVKPGVKLMDIDRAARAYIAGHGYGPYFTHRVGHNIGRAVHEEPSVNSTNPMRAQSGMCFSIEPGIYLPGKFGVRIEDLIIVSEDGCEILTHYPKHLQVVG